MNISSSSSSSSSPSSLSQPVTSPPTTSSSPSWFSSIVRGRSDLSSSVKMSSNSGSGSWDTGGPIKGKNQFRGLLFKYGSKATQVAFKTGDHKQQLVFIGGLTDGFIATEYLEPLAIALDKEKWSLVQFLMSSSYSGYGTSTLQQE